MGSPCVLVGNLDRGAVLQQSLLCISAQVCACGIVMCPEVLTLVEQMSVQKRVKKAELALKVIDEQDISVALELVRDIGQYENVIYHLLYTPAPELT